MNDNIQIINKSGEEMSTEGISYIEVPSTTKKYIFYTLNEKVDNDLTKIYISEVNPDGIVENPISESEWEDLRKKMIKISHKEAVEDVNFLSMNGVKFNVGDPKKLAITAVAKQAFKDAQISNTMATNQSATPVTTGSSAPFFNQEVLGNQANPVETSTVEQSIFANPPQPEVAISAPQLEPAVTPVVTPTVPNLVADQVVTPEVNAQPVQENIAATPESVIPPVELAPEPAVTQIPTPAPTTQAVVNAPQLETLNPVTEVPSLVENELAPAPVQNQNPVEETVVPPIPNFEPSPVVQQPMAPDPTVFASNPISESSISEDAAVEQVQEIPAQPLESLEIVKPEEQVSTETVPTPSTTRPIITDEEALKAINTIQEYINQESENNNQ